jgi:hypothetical protein
VHVALLFTDNRFIVTGYHCIFVNGKFFYLWFYVFWHNSHGIKLMLD